MFPNKYYLIQIIKENKMIYIYILINELKTYYEKLTLEGTSFLYL